MALLGPTRLFSFGKKSQLNCFLSNKFKKIPTYTPILTPTCLLISEKTSHLHGYQGPMLITNSRVSETQIKWEIIFQVLLRKPELYAKVICNFIKVLAPLWKTTTVHCTLALFDDSEQPSLASQLCTIVVKVVEFQSKMSIF